MSYTHIFRPLIFEYLKLSYILFESINNVYV